VSLARLALIARIRQELDDVPFGEVCEALGNFRHLCNVASAAQAYVHHVDDGQSDGNIDEEDRLYLRLKAALAALDEVKP
jgi:hypothetical protein